MSDERPEQDEAARRLDAAVAGALAPPPVSAERWERMLAELRAARRGAGRRRARFWAALAAAAACLAAATLLVPALRRGGARDWRSAESVSVAAASADWLPVVVAAPEGGLNVVFIAAAGPLPPPAEN